MNRGRVTDEPPLHHQMIYHNCLVPCCSTPHRFNHNFIPEQEKKEAQIENNTTASKIAIQASAKERRGTSKHKNQSRAGSKSLDNKQARRTPSKARKYGVIRVRQLEDFCYTIDDTYFKDEGFCKWNLQY
ncbi:uncharacterized protein LOC110912867 isoform X3 [Helianthus annuus]|uniref:uncharacterized protein LOC110912867 isoform X3 n=1 Tax=Helianthus annuus TaxID=4232 RepID=UPI000B8F0903|nr:uncharacterized protein LOC110912867 isoform X3 [Helianthus annuus]XP_022013388.1 uncharacterized protein LOC110912867 isoform X3 [Helianthus annuus]